MRIGIAVLRVSALALWVSLLANQPLQAQDGDTEPRMVALEDGAMRVRVSGLAARRPGQPVVVLEDQIEA